MMSGQSHAPPRNWPALCSPQNSPDVKRLVKKVFWRYPDHPALLADYGEALAYIEFATSDYQRLRQQIIEVALYGHV